MWVTALVRPIWFHDLRHTSRGLFKMKGAGLASVPKVLRHSDPRITSSTYCHLEPG
jgi:integrase